MQTKDMGVKVSREDIARFEEDGAICLRGLFDGRWVERMRSAVEGYLDGASKFAVDWVLWPTDSEMRAFAFESPAAQIAQQLMGSQSVRLFFDQIFVKEPGAEAPTPWHHDQPFWPVRGRQICSIWLALDSVSRESSGLEYVKGSHRWGREFRPAAFSEKNKDLFEEARHGEPIPDFDALRDQYEFLSWDMEPGDCLVHQALAVHGASGNRTHAQRRRALSTRWVGDDAVYAPRPGLDVKLYDERLRDGDPLDTDKFPKVIG
jgi:ectoine hydroxylase-related dioxygenase (phytanoyl-CoA dioxygenase family)